MKYRYQMHTHTAPCSKCGRTTPEELAQGLHSGGYAGCVLTNHFRHGNTGFRELQWKEFVAEYEKDYEACKKEAKKYDLDILFGIEEGVGGGKEILCYNITPELLYAHPELDGPARPDLIYKIVHEAGGIVLQAHPFRERNYITEPGMLEDSLIDGIEVYNRGNLPEENERAEQAVKPGYILTSGADTHTMETLWFAGIETDIRIRDNATLAKILKNGEYTLIKD